jgi:hypothetical protein
VKPYDDTTTLAFLKLCSFEVTSDISRTHALSNSFVYRHLKLICERKCCTFCYLFSVAFEYLNRLGPYILLTGKFTVVAKDRSALILRVKPASQPDHVRISRPLK